MILFIPPLLAGIRLHDKCSYGTFAQYSKIQPWAVVGIVASVVQFRVDKVICPAIQEGRTENGSLVNLLGWSTCRLIIW